MRSSHLSKFKKIDFSSRKQLRQCRIIGIVKTLLFCLTCTLFYHTQRILPTNFQNNGNSQSLAFSKRQFCSGGLAYNPRKSFLIEWGCSMSYLELSTSGNIVSKKLMNVWFIVIIRMIGRKKNNTITHLLPMHPYGFFRFAGRRERVHWKQMS